MKAEQDREARYRDLERAQLIAINARFPERSDSSRYILAQLMTEQDCLFCGNHVPDIAAQLESRLETQHCIVCGSDLPHVQDSGDAGAVADTRFERIATALAAIEPELDEARSQLSEAEDAYARIVNWGAELDAAIVERTSRLNVLVRMLPPEETELHTQRDALSVLRARLVSLEKELANKRTAFHSFLDEENRTLVQQAELIQAAFSRSAAGFLLEECRLVWAPQRGPLGQSGELMDFPAFGIEMSGASFPTPIRRAGPNEVSESQREFIDLAFRMALIEVAGISGIGSIVMDAPESSLDAVFVTRAADVLARFAAPDRGNRLLITSNLVDGRLLPSLLAATTTNENRNEGMVNLFDIAEPTAAVREMRQDYLRALNAMLANVHAGENSTGDDL
jgi:hypothetical protein